VTGDPPGREDDDRRSEEEAHRRAEQHRLERWAARQPPLAPGQPADPVHVVRVSLHGRPVRALCRWSLAARLIRDAAALGYDEITDLGPASPQPAGHWPRGRLVILKDPA
jgi:hypothetical protein